MTTTRNTTTGEQSELLTLRETALRLRCSYEVTRRLVRRGILPAAKLGGTYMVRPESVDEAVRRLETATTTRAR